MNCPSFLTGTMTETNGRSMRRTAVGSVSCRKVTSVIASPMGPRERGRVSAHWHAGSAPATPLAASCRAPRSRLQQRPHLALDRLAGRHTQHAADKSERHSEGVEPCREEQRQVEPRPEVADIVEVESELAAD